LQTLEKQAKDMDRVNTIIKNKLIFFIFKILLDRKLKTSNTPNQII